MKKLNKILQLISAQCPLGTPNIERVSRNKVANHIQTIEYGCNQVNLPSIWQSVEDLVSDFSATKSNLTLQNWDHIMATSEIDYKSSVKIVFELYSQLYERGQNLQILLPNLARIVEILVSKEQIKWLKEKVYHLYETVLADDSNLHGYIVYLMGKTSAILVPSSSEFENLVKVILPNYFKSNSYFVHICALHGVLALTESCLESNTRIGALSEELQLLRNLTVNYVNHHGIVESTKFADCEEHAKLVWSLTFYVIEKTSKLVPDCNLLANAIVTANNVLKRTPNLGIYLCILSVSNSINYLK